MADSSCIRFCGQNEGMSQNPLPPPSDTRLIFFGHGNLQLRIILSFPAPCYVGSGLFIVL